MNTCHDTLNLLPNVLPRPCRPRLRARIFPPPPLHCARCVADALVLSTVATSSTLLVRGPCGGIVAGSLGVVLGPLVCCVYGEARIAGRGAAGWPWSWEVSS